MSFTNTINQLKEKQTRKTFSHDSLLPIFPQRRKTKKFFCKKKEKLREKFPQTFSSIFSHFLSLSLQTFFTQQQQSNFNVLQMIEKYIFMFLENKKKSESEGKTLANWRKIIKKTWKKNRKSFSFDCCCFVEILSICFSRRILILVSCLFLWEFWPRVVMLTGILSLMKTSSRSWNHFRSNGIVFYLYHIFLNFLWWQAIQQKKNGVELMKSNIN